MFNSVEGSTSKSRILVLGSFAESLVNFRGDLIKDMIKSGCEVHVAAPDLNESIKGRLPGCSFHLIGMKRTGMNPYHDLKTCLSLVSLIRYIRPTCFLAYTIKPVIYGGIAAALCRVSVRASMITGLGFAFTARQRGLKRILQSIAKYLYRVSLQFSTAVFFQNPDDKQLFLDMKLCQRDKAVLINGSGVNIDQFGVAEFPKGDTARFVMIARLLIDKGVREFVEAARIVQRRFPSAEFHLVGWIDENPMSIGQSELDEWCESGDIVFHGRLDDVRPIIAQSHVYVLPSYREGTPRTVLEAQSMGRPVITTDAPGCRETVVEGRNGFLVPVADPVSLSEAMISFITSPESAERMGRIARSFVEDKYDVNKVNETIMSVLGIVSCPGKSS
jgi:glycosyltransferase involved in cell wall biosynthesis